MKREVFRKEALDRLSSPEQLDLLMPVTSSRGWLALAGVGLLLAMGVAWGVFGSVETMVKGTGLLMRYQGFQTVSANEPGEAVEVQVDSDSEVKPDDPLLTYLPVGADPSTPVATLRAPLGGRVLDTQVRPGSYFSADQLLVSIEAPEAPLQAVVFVPASDGFKVRAGMDVRILPATAANQGGSVLRGSVKSVARFPSTHQQLMYSLQNEEWVNSLLRLGPTLEVVVDIGDDQNLKQYYTGTPCDVSIVVDRQRPIRYLFPTSVD